MSSAGRQAAATAPTATWRRTAASLRAGTLAIETMTSGMKACLPRLPEAKDPVSRRPVVASRAVPRWTASDPTSSGEGSEQRIHSDLSPRRGWENRAYEAFHAPRFAFLLRILKERSPGTPERVLDIGLSPFTASLARSLGSPVDSLGLEFDAELAHGRQYHFDLNDAQDDRRWRTDLGPYDVIVFAEVVEHLYTAPEKVLRYLHSLMAPGGALVLQTPNAAALRKRLKLLLGRNPYERIRLDRANPGHFREYTVEELHGILAQTGFSVRNTWMRYYFDSRFARHETGHEAPALVVGAVKNLVYQLVPGKLQEGITILARREA